MSSSVLSKVSLSNAHTFSQMCTCKCQSEFLLLSFPSLARTHTHIHPHQYSTSADRRKCHILLHTHTQTHTTSQCKKYICDLTFTLCRYIFYIANLCVTAR